MKERSNSFGWLVANRHPSASFDLSIHQLQVPMTSWFGFVDSVVLLLHIYIYFSFFLIIDSLEDGFVHFNRLGGKEERKRVLGTSGQDGHMKGEERRGKKKRRRRGKKKRGRFGITEAWCSGPPDTDGRPGATSHPSHHRSHGDHSSESRT